MKKLIALVSVGFFAVVVVLGVVVALVVFAPKGQSTLPSGDSSATDQGQYEMLETDQQILERMRVSVSPNMATMIDQNPM